jgi:hypothetical protein
MDVSRHNGQGMYSATQSLESLAQYQTWVNEKQEWDDVTQKEAASGEDSTAER